MRTIDADVLIKEAECSEHDNPHTDGIARSAHRHEHRHFIAMIDDAPTIEAYTEADVISAYNEGVAYGAEKAVRHGRWERVTSYGTYKCSACGAWDTNCDDYYGSHYVTEQNFCPNCGAKMDGGTDNEV